jgi:flagellar hook-associated protein FlgK
MNLTGALNTAVSGLNISQKALSVISNNIANANTEGYSAQKLEISAVYLGGQMGGATVDDITRRVDKYLQNSIRTQSAVVGRTSTLNDYMERMQILMGNPGDTNSLDEYTNKFITSLQTLAETPDRTSNREQVVNNADTLAREISSLADGLQVLRQEADSDMANAVDDVNRSLNSIASINTAINRASALGNPTAGLFDKRDQALKELSQYMDISISTQDTGEVFVYSKSGVTLLDKSVYQLRYNEAGSQDVFNSNTGTSAVDVVLYDENHQVINNPQSIISSGDRSSISSELSNGKLQALHELRDQLIPDVIAQLDEFAAGLRDAVNEIHNQGSSYPGTSELTGTRAVSSLDAYNWSGSIRIAVLDGDGNPATSAYSDELATGVRPLELNLETLDSGNGNQQPSLQNIIDEINNHFWPPTVKTEVGNLNNIQLVSDTTSLPQAPQAFSFDFDLDNISNLPANFYMTGITVLDDSGTPITNVTQAPPQVTLNAVNTYSTTLGSNQLTINANAHGLKVGDRVFLSDPLVAVNGISNSDMTGYFEITSAGANSFTVQLGAGVTANATGNATVAGMTATPPWDSVDAGEKTRINGAGTVSLDLTGNAGSTYYDITVNVGVDDGTGSASTIPTATITYRVFNNQSNLFNDRYNSTAATGNVERVVPNTDQYYMHAIMVDENGDELPKQNGVYQGQTGYLKLETNNPNNTIAIDELDSKQLGITSTTPNAAGTNRGFSYYFELNNFFKSNNPTSTGDTTEGSALNFAIEDRLDQNSNLISLGQLEKTYQPASGNAVYTYERSIANNEIVQKLADLANQTVSFDEAGGLSSSKVTVLSYASNILAFSAASATAADSADGDANVLLSGFVERSDTFSGVNVDEELANTIVFQHAYSASARVISVVSAMFDALLAAGQ